jgi:hypothetical protein
MDVVIFRCGCVAVPGGQEDAFPNKLTLDVAGRQQFICSLRGCNLQRRALLLDPNEWAFSRHFRGILINPD